VLAKTDQVSLPAGKAFTVEGVCVNDVAGRARLTMRLNGNQVLETTRTDSLDNGVQANITSGPLVWIANINLDYAGYAIVGLFFASWLIAIAVWRFGRIESRWSAHLASD